FSILNFGFATGTAIFTTTSSSTNLWSQQFNGSGLSTCGSASTALSWTAGRFGCQTLSFSAGLPNSKWATSTNSDISPNGNGGIMVFASSTITTLNINNSTTSQAFATTASSTNLSTTLLNGAGLSTCG